VALVRGVGYCNQATLRKTTKREGKGKGNGVRHRGEKKHKKPTNLLAETRRTCQRDKVELKRGG